jgi:hypothetical protein
MKDIKGTELQKGMYIVYASEHYDSLEQRIALILDVKTVTPEIGKPYTFLSIKSARRVTWNDTWEIVKSSGLKHSRGIFAVSTSHIPDAVVKLLERK